MIVAKTTIITVEEHSITIMVSLLLLVVVALNQWCYPSDGHSQAYSILNESEVLSLFSSRNITHSTLEGEEEEEEGYDMCYIVSERSENDILLLLLVGVSLVTIIGGSVVILACISNYRVITMGESRDIGEEKVMSSSLPSRETHFYIDKKGYAVRAKIIERE